jgi:hypothetical protein
MKKTILLFLVFMMYIISVIMVGTQSKYLDKNLDIYINVFNIISSILIFYYTLFFKNEKNV